MADENEILRFLLPDLLGKPKALIDEEAPTLRGLKTMAHGISNDG